MMFESLFEFLYAAIYSRFLFALFAALAWGVLSILLSPCHLSSIPLVIGYVSSQGDVQTKKSFNLSLVFSIGTLISIALIGLITAGMGRILGDVGQLGNYLVALIFVLIGLVLMDVLPLNWNSFNIGGKKYTGFSGAFMLGFIFGIGLGPCTFAFMAPVLGVVFKTAGENPSQAVALLALFGIGHCSIIALAGSFTPLVQKYLNWSGENKSVFYIKRAAGFLVLLGGVYFIFTKI